jgi:hypothetical protein
VTLRLGATALGSWPELDGFAVAHGIQDPRTLPLDRFCNLVWYLISKGEDATGIAKARAKLWRPPPQAEVIPARSPWSAESESAGFASLKAGLTGTVSKPPLGTDRP